MLLARESIQALCEDAHGTAESARYVARECLFDGDYRNINRHRVHDIISLKLDPDPICARAREDDIELYVSSSRSDYGMFVNYIQSVVAGYEHVGPRA